MCAHWLFAPTLSSHPLYLKRPQSFGNYLLLCIYSTPAEKKGLTPSRLGGSADMYMINKRMFYLLDMWVYFFAWNVFDCTWFWMVLKCTWLYFLTQRWYGNLASTKFATADLWSWKKGFKSLMAPCLYAKLECWESCKQARNLPTLIWRSLHSPLSELLVLGQSLLSRCSSTAFIRKTKPESQRQHDTHSIR